MDLKDIIVEITSDGSCMGVYSDNNPLMMLGDLQVTRLSDVEFDAQQQAWTVAFRNGTKLPGTYKERINALAAEILYVDAHMAEFGEWVKANHPESVSEGFPEVDPSIG